MPQEPGIGEWLRGLGLPQYEAAFADNAVDTETLGDLTEADLEKIGVLLGHRKKMLRSIAARGASPVAPPRAEGGERRQLTVMFCDLVASTALAGRLDPEDLREVLAAYQAKVGEVAIRFGGFIARYMGDGMMVYFGYPRADEDDAERAVRAGLALVDEIAGLDLPSGKLRARVGIATGLVVVGDLLGSGDTKERDVVGETPNLAARLQAAAGPDTVLISAATRQLVGGLFELRNLGSSELRGFNQAIPVWQPLRPSSIETRFEALRASSLTPLVGRAEEIGLLRQKWAEARRGDGRVVLLSGEAGIGKSRTVAAFQAELRGQAYVRVRLSCSPHHRDSALHPIIAHLERAAGFARDDAPAAKLDKIEALVSRSGEDPAEAAKLFADLLSVPTEGRYPPLELDPQRRRELMFAAFVRLLEGLARQQPVLAVFEDAHWVDSTSLQVVNLVIERVPRLPVLLVITFRPEFHPSWVNQTHVTMLPLDRLGERESAALIGKVAGDKALPDEIVDRIVERTDGVPLFVEELTKSLLESRLLREQDGRYVLDRPLPPLAIPSSLHASLLARLDRLAPVKEVAQIGAALGREFSYELLAAVAERSEEELEEALEQLAGTGLVFHRGDRPRTTFVFKHALVQDAAYSTLLRGQRQELHARIGKVLQERFPETEATEPEILAHHFTRAGLADAAIDYWRKAGERALRASADVEGVTHLTHALDLVRSLPPGPGRDRRELDLHLALGRMMRATKGYAAAETLRVFSRARSLLSDAATVNDQMTVLYGLWSVHYVRAEHGAAREVARQCLALAERHPRSEAPAFAHMLMGHALWAIGEFVSGRAHLQRTVDLGAAGIAAGGDPGPPRNNVIAALSYLGCALWPLGYPEQAVAAARRAVALARDSGHVPLTAYVMYIEAFLAAAFGADDGAAADAEEAVAYCVEHGVSAYEHWARFCQGLNTARRGDPREGIETMRGAMAAARAIDAKMFRPLHLGHLAAAYSRIARPEIGIGLLNEAFETIEATGERFFEAELHRLRGELLLEAGNGAEGQDELERALKIARRQQARLWELRAAGGLARAWAAEGRRAEARDLLRPVYGWFAEGLDSPDLRQARGLLRTL